MVWHHSETQNFDFNKSLFHAGMWYIRDFFDDRGILIPFSVWQRRGVLLRFYLEWRAVISAVTKYMRTKGVVYTIDNENPSFDLLIENKMSFLDCKNKGSLCLYCS